VRLFFPVLPCLFTPICILFGVVHVHALRETFDKFLPSPSHQPSARAKSPEIPFPDTFAILLFTPTFRVYFHFPFAVRSVVYLVSFPPSFGFATHPFPPGEAVSLLILDVPFLVSHFPRRGESFFSVFLLREIHPLSRCALPFFDLAFLEAWWFDKAPSCDSLFYHHGHRTSVFQSFHAVAMDLFFEIVASSRAGLGAVSVLLSSLPTYDRSGPSILFPKLSLNGQGPRRSR